MSVKSGTVNGTEHPGTQPEHPSSPNTPETPTDLPERQEPPGTPKNKERKILKTKKLNISSMNQYVSVISLTDAAHTVMAR